MPDTTRCTEDEVRALLELSEQATPGEWESSSDAIPWKANQRGPFTDRGASITSGSADVVVGGLQDEQGGAVGVLRNEDATFIAAARNIAPRLAADWLAMRELLASAASLHRWCATNGFDVMDAAERERGARGDIVDGDGMNVGDELRREAEAIHKFLAARIVRTGGPR